MGEITLKVKNNLMHKKSRINLTFLLYCDIIGHSLDL